MYALNNVSLTPPRPLLAVKQATVKLTEYPDL